MTRLKINWKQKNKVVLLWNVGIHPRVSVCGTVSVSACSVCSMASNLETLVCCGPCSALMQWELEMSHRQVRWVMGLCPQPAELRVCTPTQIYKPQDCSADWASFNLLRLWRICFSGGRMTQTDLKAIHSAHTGGLTPLHWNKTQGEITAKLENWSGDLCSGSVVCWIVWKCSLAKVEAGLGEKLWERGCCRLLGSYCEPGLTYR